MDVENQVVTPPEEEVVEIKSEDENESGDDVCVLLSPLSTPTGKSPCTPINGHTSSPVTSTPASVSKKRKRLSSKEREEREKHRAEKRAKLEEEKQRKEEEKNKKEQERLAKLQQKEQERLKREEEKNKKEEERKKKLEEIEKQKKLREEERQKKLEEEEKRKKEKEEERRQKEEEKKKKLEEEEKRKKEKEEERLKREQEKQQKLEEKEREKKKDEEKRQKQAQMFTSFFQKSPGTKTTPRRVTLTRISDCQRTDGADLNDSHSGDLFESSSKKDRNLFNPMMFEVKSNMVLAPVVRRKLTPNDKKNFDKTVLALESNEEDEIMEIEDPSSPQSSGNYLTRLKQKGGRKYKNSCSSVEADVQIVSHTIIENPKAQGLVKWRYKLLQFHTNNRPAYWGTWKRKPATVIARNPFKQEKDLDYEFDSDDEWEEEPEDGEELGDSEKEDDPENEEEEDDEEGWLVPHGYISDDEGSVDEHLDKETLKIEEKNYFEGLKKQIKIKLPEIQTANFSEFRIIFSPLRKKWREVCAAKAAELSKLELKTDVNIVSS